MSAHSENVKAMIVWALQVFAGPHAKTVPLGAIDALVERSESSADFLIAIRDAIEALLAEVLAGQVVGLDAATLAALETITISNADFPDANSLATLELIRALLAALPLPTGAATSVAQGFMNSSLTSIDGKLPALDGGRLPVSLSTASATGTITTANLSPTGVATAGSAVEITLGDTEAIAVQVTGVYTGALSLQVTLNGATWVTVGGTPLLNVNTYGFLASITSALQGVFQGQVAGAVKARITALAAVTGTATVTIKTVSDPSVVVGQMIASQVGTWTMQPGNTANTTPWLFTPSAGISGGLTRHRLIAAATTNPSVVKATAGQVFKIQGHNLAGTDRFLKFYNKATAPTVGTDPVLETYVLKAGQPFVLDFSTFGNPFAAGIAYAITGALADADTTAIAAGDVVLNLHYK